MGQKEDRAAVWWSIVGYGILLVLCSCIGAQCRNDRPSSNGVIYETEWVDNPPRQILVPRE